MKILSSLFHLLTMSSFDHTRIKSVVLLSHGLDGSVKDFTVIQNALNKRIDLETTLVLNPNLAKTYDGIANGANRLYDHLIEATSDIPPNTQIKLSVMVCPEAN